jgi:hypothetical protein
MKRRALLKSIVAIVPIGAVEPTPAANEPELHTVTIELNGRKLAELIVPHPRDAVVRQVLS